jgi:signal transduction histidine kinase
MNYYTLIPFTAFLVNGFMFVYIFAQDRKTRINRAYLHLAMALTAWGLLDFIGWSDVSHQWRLVVIKLTPVAWGSLGFLALWVAYAFTNRKSDILFWIIYSFHLASIPLSLFTGLIHPGYQETAWGIREIMGPLSVPMIMTNVAIPILFSIVLLVKKYMAATDASRRMVLLVVLGFSSAAILGFLFEIVLPEILEIRSFPELGPFMSVVLGVFVYRAVARHHFLSVTLEEAAIEIFDNAIDGIIIEDNNRSTVLANKAARQLLGIDRMPDRIRDIPVLSGLGDIQDQVMREIAFENEHRRIELTVYPAPIIKKEITVGRLIIMRDMTEKKRVEKEKRSLEEQLLQAQKMEAVGTLAGGIAHDMNNVLAGIMGFASLINESLDSEDPMAEDIQEILVSARRGRDLTKDLLGFARKGAYKKQEESLNKIVSELLPILERTIPKRINIEYRDYNAPCYIECDPGQINHALMNLCINAADAMEEGGDLILTIDPIQLTEKTAKEYSNLLPGDYARLRVIDTGKGIDKKTISRVFEPFFTTKQPGQGTGLGLSMVYGTVNNHGGQVKMDSSPGEGTTVTVVLPAILQLSKPEDKDVPPRDSLLPAVVGTVLLVDDEPVARNSAQRMLSRLGYNVILACNGVEAVEVYKNQKAEIDLVILDMAMPEMDGSKCFGELKGLNPDVQVLISSGFARGKDTDALLKGGAIGFLPKPFEIEQLAEAVHK